MTVRMSRVQREIATHKSTTEKCLSNITVMTEALDKVGLKDAAESIQEEVRSITWSLSKLSNTFN